MKVVLSIEIKDDTPMEVLNAHGVTSDMMHDMYREAFAGLLRECVHPGARWELLVHIADNTKEVSGNGRT